MDTDRVNKMWQRAHQKHQQREAVQPKSPPHQRWAVVTRDTSMEPISGRTRERLKA